MSAKLKIKYHKSKRRAGFTLLEMLVAVGVIGMVATLLLQIFVTTSRTNTKVELLKDIKQNGDFAIEVISRILRSAQSVTSTCSDAGTTSTAISVVNPDDGATTIGCGLAGSVTRIASTSAGRTDYLTSDNVTLGGADCTDASLSFICTGQVGAPPTVNVTFTLSQKGSPVAQFEKAPSSTFQTTVTVRALETQ